METLPALKALDGNRFEMLVAYYLRRHNPQLRGLIATGTNAAGEPIPCPVDGVLYYPGPSPTCTVVACTTTERKDLKVKWFGSKTKRGDVEKAINELAAWRAIDQSAHLRLYLAVNYPLESSLELYREVVEAGRQKAVAVEVIEASQLQDFLDHDADGQYIRQVLLGIPAQRMSESLLRKIAAASLRQHSHRFALEPASAEGEVRRELCSEVVRTVSQTQNSLVVLVGPSGNGKSTLLRQAGWQILGSGGIAVWCPAEDLSAEIPIAAVIL